MTVKTLLLLFMTTCFLQTLVAQTDTIYYDALHQTVENRTLCSYYKTVKKRDKIEIHEEYYVNGNKRSHVMYKKVPEVSPEELVVVGFNPTKNKSKANSKPKTPLIKDSVVVKHGTFIEWYESGEVKTHGSFFVGKLHDELNIFYKNQKPKRQDVYHLDTLKSGRCFDSLGNEIAYFPYYVSPEFVGGQIALFQFLGKNVIYPKDARESGKQGTAYISFVVDKDGKIRKVNADAMLNQNMDKQLIEEAARVVKTLPTWKAGLIDGETVNVRYTLPIKFKME